jgi:hypothetical protein
MDFFVILNSEGLRATLADPNSQTCKTEFRSTCKRDMQVEDASRRLDTAKGNCIIAYSSKRPTYQFFLFSFPFFFLLRSLLCPTAVAPAGLLALAVGRLAPAAGRLPRPPAGRSAGARLSDSQLPARPHSQPRSGACPLEVELERSVRPAGLKHGSSCSLPPLLDARAGSNCRSTVPAICHN